MNRNGRGDQPPNHASMSSHGMMNQYHHQGPNNRGGRGGPRRDLNRMTLAERTKSPGGGRGRGCTVETQQEWVFTMQK